MAGSFFLPLPAKLTFLIEMVNPSYIIHLDNIARIIIVWSE